jgi:hypothetical protein
LILGILGISALLDDSPWDMETVAGVLVLAGITQIVLGVITISQKFEGKAMGIIGIILGCINSLAMLGLMTEM